MGTSLLLVLLGGLWTLQAQEGNRRTEFPGNATIAGPASAPYPTITNLSIEWTISGDDNLNGVVKVAYRAAGETRWRQAMPLVRVPAGSSRGTTPTFKWANRHSGSIFDLRPGTAYEIRLTLRDPDGGSAETALNARTRPVPRPAPGSRAISVNAATFKEAAANAEPGVILNAAPGYYGTFEAVRDGEPGKPIVIRGQSAGPIRTTFDSVSLRGRKHVILENVAVNGSVDLLGGEDLTIRRCLISAQYGIVARHTPGAKNCYIADNEVVWKMPWVPEGMGHLSIYGGAANSGEGIEITGPGNVICHNRVRGFRDCISLMEDTHAGEQVSIDIYNNDVEVGVDDGIEADFCMGNCRVMRNRLTNCFMGLSSQPSLGGPTYFIRNVMYNLVEAPFKLMRGSSGNVILHNSVLKTGDGLRVPGDARQYSRCIFRNNLCLGGTGSGMFGRYTNGAGRALYAPKNDPTNDLDYNGVGAVGVPFSAEIGPRRFSSLDELRRVWPHMVRGNIDVFERADFPDPPVPERPHADLRLRAGSVAIDAGQRLPNVNDGYSGEAPDLGAYEYGRELPLYGPRPVGIDEETEWKEPSGPLRARQGGNR